MHFCHAESTFEYMNVTKRYLLEYGKPVAFYSDKHAVFRVNKADLRLSILMIAGFPSWGPADFLNWVPP